MKIPRVSSFSPGAGFRLLRRFLPLLLLPLFATAQTAPVVEEEAIEELNPFEVSAEDSDGYVATSTLAGTRIRTDLRDIGSAISVYTTEFLQDIGAYDNESLMAYTVNTDVGGPQGTFVNANSQGEENENFGAGFANVRIRGLTLADNTRDYFKTDTPWDAYNTGRTEVIRGANSILFGLGSPAGIVNASSNRAIGRDLTSLNLRFDEHGSLRAALDLNRVVFKDEFSVRVALLHNHQKYQQDPAFQKDKRAWGTFSLSPKFLQSQSSSLRLDGAFETAEIESNSRRGQAPFDYASYFFLPPSEGGLGGQTVNRNDPADQPLLFIDYGLPTQRANPMISNAWGNGTTVLVYDGTEQPVDIFEKEINSVNGYRFSGGQALVNTPAGSGSSATSIQGTVQPVFFNGYRNYAEFKGWEFFSRYRDRALTDPLIYDFFNQMIDGDSKREFRDWYNGRLELTHSFFDNKLSYNLQYFKQEMEFNRYAALGQSSQIRIDAGELLPDGRPNPNAGKAYLRESPFQGGRIQSADRDAWRATLYLEHDFSTNRESFLGRLVNKQFVTGSLSQQRSVQFRSDYMAAAVGPDWVQTRLVNSNPIQRDQFQTRARILNYFYISDSLVGKSLGQDLGIRNIGPGVPIVTGTYQSRYFDADIAHFAPGVNPAATDPVYGRQAQNPNNYRGWITAPIEIIGAGNDNTSNEYLTRVRDHFKETVDSLSLVWQGRFLQNSLVATYGWRQDDYTSRQYTWDSAREISTAPDPSLAAFQFDPTKVSGETTNWSLVFHAREIFRQLPFNLSLQYSKGENTNPDPARVGVFRNPVFSAEGSTTDKSIVLSTRDNKYILRLTEYETSVKNASSTSTLQSQKFLLEQTFFQSFASVDRIITDQETRWGQVDPVLIAAETAGTLTPAQATNLAAQRVNVPKHIAAANAWLDFEQRFADLFPQAVAAWKPADGIFPGSIQAPGMGWSFPENAVLLEDTVSTGWEAEFVANPTRDWRISANVSQTEAIRDNIPGAEFAAVMDFIWSELNGPVGTLPLAVNSSTAAATTTSRDRFTGLYDAYEVQLQQNGQAVNELSKWRYGLVTSYSFREGFLKGFTFGGSYRYEDPKTIGYGYKYNDQGDITVDLDNQYRTDPIHTVGFTARYGRRLGDKVNWSIQANLYNAFEGDQLIATTTQPDGSIASGMIRDGRTWAITNNFSF